LKNTFFFLLVSVLLIPVAFSATVQEEFLKTSTSVRQMGMGGAGTAVCDDISATFYNPAGLARNNPSGMSFGTIDTNKEIYDEDHYYAYGFGSLGYLGYDKKTSDGKVNVDMFGIARQGGMGLSYGLTFKNVYWETSTEAHRGYSADVGLLINVSPQLSIGMLGQDSIAEKALDIPGSLRLGFAYRPFEDRVIIAADTEIGRQGPGDFTHYGVEGVVTDGLILRAGIDRGYTAFGISLDLNFMTIHYAALLSRDAPNGTVHMIGGEMSFMQRPERPMTIIRPKEYALIDIGGDIVGGLGDFSIFGGGRVGADSIIANIKEAVKDPYIDGIILKIRGFDGGIGSFGIVQEIRGELQKAKDKGIKVVAYLEEGTLGDEYYLASVADRVVAPSSGTVGGLGKSISVIRIKGLLEKFGLEAQVLAMGKYKTTFSEFSPEMTREQRTALQGVLSDLYRQMINEIAESRSGKISKKKLKEIADGRVLSAASAKELGLIDEVGYFRDASRVGAELYKSKDDIRIVERKDLIRDLDEEFLIAFPNKVAVVDIDGDIITGRSGQNIIFGGHATGADTVCSQIKKAADDWQVKAIIVRINSGGGSVVASGQIYSELKRARQKGKIIVASMGDIAASGGYYVAAAANKIVADPGTITGSIGVIQRNIIYAGLLKKLDIKSETLKEGAHSDMFSGLRRLSTEEVKMLTSYMEETYQEFIGVVAEGRGMTTTEVASIAGGRIYTGAQALDKKLVDKLGNFTASVDLAADLAKISGEPKLVYYREESFLSQLGLGAMNMLGIEGGLFNNRPAGLAEYRLSL